MLFLYRYYCKDCEEFIFLDDKWKSMPCCPQCSKDKNVEYAGELGIAYYDWGGRLEDKLKK